MNKIFLIGNLTGDPELRTTLNGITVCTMNLAVNRRFSGNREERQTDFYRVTAWRQLGETCSRFLSKGKKIAVVGEFVPRTYEGKDGATRVSLEVTAEEIEFLSPRDAASGQSYPQQGYQSNQQGYNRNYPPQDYQSAQDGGNFSASRQNSWQDGRGQQSARDGFAANSFDSANSSGSATDGFTEISDSDLPF